MRIGINFHTMDENISGVEYYSLGLINALVRFCRQHHYIVYTNQRRLVEQYVPASDNLTVVKVRSLNTRIARIIWEQTLLPRLATRDGLDLLHCLSYVCPILKKSLPYIVTIHDTIAIEYPRWCRRTNALHFNILMKAVVDTASRIIAVSKFTGERLRHIFNQASSKLRVIYPGIDEIFRHETNRYHQAAIKNRYKLPDRYILYVGNIEPKKNVMTVLKLQDSLSRLGWPHKLVIVGKRTWRAREELKAIKRACALKQVIRTGYVERSDLPYIYQMADVFVFPSLCEGFGFPPLEAMACGTPVVSTCRGALGETIREAALIVEPDDISQITQAVVSLLKDESLRERHIRAGFYTSARFRWARAAGQTLSVYEEIFKSR